MNEVETQVIESLQFLLSIQKVSSPRYIEKLADIMAKNHLLLNPIEKPSIAEKTNDAFCEVKE